MKKKTKNQTTSTIRLPRIDLEYPIEVALLPAIKELKMSPKKSQNVSSRVMIDDSSHQTISLRNESGDDDSDGSITG